uniref:Uncharacterized protein n=1 Tax=Labrus bergylta TaxID=56723 RepID=A0A3Q3H1X8_9LABR
MFEVQVFGFLQCDEELGVNAWACVPDIKVFIFKLAAVDGLASCAITVFWYDSMEDGSPKAKPFLASAESPEVFSRLGDNMGKELYVDCAKWLAISFHFEENLWVSVSGVLLNSGHLR